MNLDDLARISEIDAGAMRSHLDALPDTLTAAWSFGASAPLQPGYGRAERIVIAGVGNAALAGDLVAALVADSCNVPILVHRGYELPAYAEGQRTLVILLDHGGNGLEVRSALETADARGTQTLTITSGGELAAAAQRGGMPLWNYTVSAPSPSPSSPARAALGWQVGLMLQLLSRIGLIADQTDAVNGAVATLKRSGEILTVESPVLKNPAKRLAGQMIGRTPLIYGGGILAPIARRWKTMLNQNGKTLASWEEIPEMNHNALAGIFNPPPLMTKVAVVFLASKYDPAPIAARRDLTRQIMLQEGLASDVVQARGDSPLAHALSAAQFGDYVSYYVAIAYENDPTPTPMLSELIERLG
jgi:glucose/mannose-6-phosphate isomerase